MKVIANFLCLVCAASIPVAAVNAGDGAVQLEKKADSVVVTIGDEEFAVYNYAQALPKPFFSPVRGPGGTILTRGLKNPADHPHHKGAWVSVDEVNGIKFWAEQGKIVTQSVKLLEPSGNPARLQVVNYWQNTAGEPQVTETTTISIYPNRLMAYDIKFSADHGPVVFEDTKEGLFGFRMVDSMRENEGGHVINADGLKGSKEAWGKTSAWVDYVGTVEGKTFGVTLFDHPDNFRPSRYHVRNYGLFSVSPFGEKSYAKQESAPVHLKKGESLQLRYALYVHAGDTESANVAQVYQQYVDSAK